MHNFFVVYTSGGRKRGALYDRSELQAVQGLLTIGENEMKILKKKKKRNFPILNLETDQTNESMLNTLPKRRGESSSVNQDRAITSQSITIGSEILVTGNCVVTGNYVVAFVLIIGNY